MLDDVDPVASLDSRRYKVERAPYHLRVTGYSNRRPVVFDGCPEPVVEGKPSLVYCGAEPLRCVLVVEYRGRPACDRDVRKDVVVRDQRAAWDEETGSGTAVCTPDFGDCARSSEPSLKVADRDESAFAADDLL